MQIITQNYSKGSVKLKITTPEDLWQLTHLLDIEDSITSQILRKIKLSGKDERSNKIIKKSALVTINLEKIDLKENLLKLSGKITQSSNEDIPKGSYQSINLELNSILKIEKPKFYSYQIKRIEESTKQKLSKILICTLDREEASFALLKDSGYELLSELQGEVEKKEQQQTTKPFYPEIIKTLEAYDKKYKLEHIIIASPAFWKDNLLKEIKSQELKSKIILATCSAIGIQAIDEVLKRDELKQALNQDRISKETKLVEQLLANIAKNTKFSYGLKETENTSNTGAIETLLITDKLIKEARENNTYQKIDNILKIVDSTNGEIYIISTDHQAGKKLQGLTGIGAILRY